MPQKTKRRSRVFGTYKPKAPKRKKIEVSEHSSEDSNKGIPVPDEHQSAIEQGIEVGCPVSMAGPSGTSVEPSDMPGPSIKPGSEKPSEPRAVLKRRLLSPAVEPVLQPDEQKWENKYMLLDTNMISIFCDCGCNDNNVRQDTIYGFSSKLSINCADCGKVLGSFHSSAMYNNVLDVNRRMVHAFDSLGLGYAAVEKFCQKMNMHCMSSRTYSRHHQSLKSKVISSSDNWEMEVSKAVRTAYTDINPELSGKEIIDISVSYDGTWQKRGHQSHTGVGVAIDCITGLVLDYEVLSSYCDQCSKAKGRLPDDEYNEWFQNHVKTGECQKNYDGSAGGMEVAAAVAIWRRSISKFGLRYVTMLSDGDCKSYRKIVEEDVYEGQVQIEKEECINHVGKRLGAALRNIKKMGVGDDVKVGGRGRLSDARIKSWQSYYYGAIKNNKGNIEAMQNAIFAIPLHSMSTAESHCHTRCHPSWCYHLKALANEKEPVVPATHQPLPKELGTRLIPLFQRLAQPDLLKRCEKGKTQNANESFNNVLWTKCPKRVYVSLSTAKARTSMAVKIFNQGPLAEVNIMEDLDLPAGFYSKKLATRAAQRSEAQARLSNRTAFQEARKHQKSTKSRKCKIQNDKEGNLYAAGME